MGSFNDIYSLILWDLIKLRHEIWFVVARIAWFIFQALVFGMAIARMVAIGGTNYYLFYLVGLYVSLQYSVAMSAGYRIADEFDEGIVEYHLSLPLKRGILAFGRVLGLSLRTALMTFPVYVFLAYLIGVSNPVDAMLAFLALFAFAVGVTSLMVTIVFTVKSQDATDIVAGIMDALLVRLSTIFYPMPVIARIAPYYYGALANPVSHAADFTRYLLLGFPTDALVASPMEMALFVLGFSAGFSVIAVELFERKLEAGGWK
ncbi:MAG: ABC transporter [Desulfurococcaceae archaeon]